MYNEIASAPCSCYTVVKLLRYKTLLSYQTSAFRYAILTELQASYTKLIGHSRLVHARQLDTAKRSRVSIRVKNFWPWHGA